jgi:tRNA(Ile)-lysidine synthase TilS/MesJ
MLNVTRQDVEEFLEEWCLSHITDSSNETDAFLRNRLRHHVMPLLKQENPRLAENLSAMALTLRKDEEVLSSLIPGEELPDVKALREMPAALRSRAWKLF